MDKTIKEIIEIDDSSKYIVIFSAETPSKDVSMTLSRLRDFLRDSDKVFFAISDRIELRKMD